MEAYFETVSQVYFFTMDMLAAYCLFCLVKDFLRERRHAWFAGIAYFLALWVLYKTPYVFSNFVVYGLAVLAAYAVMCLLERERRVQKLFLTITFFSLRWMAMSMAHCLDYLYWAVFYPWAQRFFAQDLSDFAAMEWGNFWFFLAETVGGAVTNMVFMFSAVWVVRKFYIFKCAEMEKKEFFMLAAPSFSGMVGYHMLKMYQTLYAEETGKSLYDAFGGFPWLAFLYYAISFATVLAMIVLFQDIKRGQEDEMQGKLLSGQVESMKRYIEEVERRQKEIRSLKHDMGNHIMTLEGLFAKKEYGKVEEYVARLRKEYSVLSGSYGEEIKSGNPVTDVILAEKAKEAKAKGVALNCRFCYPEAMGIHVFDLSIILNNAVSNALEHGESGGGAQIHIRSYRRGNVYMMEFTNRFYGKLFLDADSGLLWTTKMDKGTHGFGLQNIRRVAQKYKGDIDMEADGENFKLSVMLLSAGEEKR